VYACGGEALRPADLAVLTTAVLLNVRHDLATPADQHPMMAPGPVRVVHRGDAVAQPEIPADTARVVSRDGDRRRVDESRRPSSIGATKLALVPASW
jgi:hypothetical protein